LGAALGRFSCREPLMTRMGILLGGALTLALCGVGGAAMAHEAKSSASASTQVARFSGLASFYSKDYSGPTASGDPYDPKQFTAAHRTLPFGTLLTITDLSNGRRVTVVVNDRGPFVDGRVLDLSRAAAKALQVGERGIAKVSAQVEQPRPIHLRDLLSRNER
jgi:peptidoglycan lytic transglycosylase